MSRWLLCLVLAIVLGLIAVLVPLPGIVGTLIYAGAAIAAVLFLVFLVTDVFRRPPACVSAHLVPLEPVCPAVSATFPAAPACPHPRRSPMSEPVTAEVRMPHTMTVQTPDEHRPDPIGNAVKSVGAGISAALGVVGFLAGAGVITATQADALYTLGEGLNLLSPLVGGVVSGLFALVTGFVAAWASGAVAKQETTPVRDPRNSDGARLIVHPADA